MAELQTERLKSSRQEAEKANLIAKQIAAVQKELKQVEETTFVAKHEKNKPGGRLRAKIQALEAEKRKCEQEATRLQTNDGNALSMAKIVREELQTEENTEEEARNLPRWRVLETCSVRAALELDSEERLQLHSGDEIVELDQGVVEDEMHIRFDRGWVASESLEKKVDGSEDAQDERAKRVQEAMDKLKAQELEVQALCRAQQLSTWVRGRHPRLGQDSPLALLVRCASMIELDHAAVYTLGIANQQELL